MIRQDLESGAIDTVVVAGCSPRVKAEAFSFNHGSVVERVNLREHVAWCQKPQDEDANMLAADYLRMGIARALKTEPSEAMPDAVCMTILVVGGGLAGITAALEAADADYEVVLVRNNRRSAARRQRREPRPTRAAVHRTAAANGSGDLIQAVSYHSRIRVFTSAEILKTEGQPGAFDVTLRRLM